MKIAICIYGNISLWEYTKDSFKNILCNNIDADIFVSTYTQKQPSYTENDIINMFKDINLKGIIIEDRESILNTFNENILNNDILKKYEKHRQLYICNDIKKKYEHENNFKYDIVIETSFDVIYLNSPEWNLLLSNNIVLENHDCMEKSILAGNNSVMDMIINDRNTSYLVNSTYDYDILSNFCKINNIEIITLLDNNLIYIPSIGSKSIFDIENYELQDKIIKSLFSNKVKYISEDLILNTNDTNNIVLLTSMVYISNDHNKGVYTPEERISQIIINCKNIRDKIPNSIIILLEGSKLTNYAMFTLCKHVDHLILY